MSKKKPVTKTTPKELTTETPQSGATYHATFTPTWRPEIDCGDHDSVDDAKQAVVDAASKFKAVSFKPNWWSREDLGEWVATGHDGQIETNLPIAKIMRVGQG